MDLQSDLHFTENKEIIMRKEDIDLQKEGEEFPIIAVYCDSGCEREFIGIIRSTNNGHVFNSNVIGSLELSNKDDMEVIKEKIAVFHNNNQSALDASFIDDECEYENLGSQCDACDDE